jgi:hypothetical protein
MSDVRARWRAGPPEFLILAGASVGFLSSAAALALAFATEPVDAWAGPVALLGGGIALSIATGILLARPGRPTARRFLVLGLVATALAVLSWPGLLGGGIALAGTLWGIARTYAPRA